MGYWYPSHEHGVRVTDIDRVGDSDDVMSVTRIFEIIDSEIIDSEIRGLIRLGRRPDGFLTQQSQ